MFRMRYQNYKGNLQEFPHEMGILLGYPVEDVVGFMKDEGKDFLYTGYWKVYRNLAEKILLFRSYELVKEQQIQMIAEGIQMSQIINWYGKFLICSNKTTVNVQYFSIGEISLIG